MSLDLVKVEQIGFYIWIESGQRKIMQLLLVISDSLRLSLGLFNWRTMLSELETKVTIEYVWVLHPPNI